MPRAFRAACDLELSSLPHTCCQAWTRSHCRLGPQPPQPRSLQAAKPNALAPSDAARILLSALQPSPGCQTLGFRAAPGRKQLCLCLWGYGTRHAAPGIIQLPYLAYTARGRGSCALLSSSTTAPPMQGGRVAGLRPLHHLAKLLADNENSRKTVQMQAKKTTHQPSIPTPAQSWMHQNIPIFSDQSNNIVPTAVHPSRAAEFD